MLIAAEVIDEGCETVPPPEKLFALLEEEEDSLSWTSSDSGSESSSIEVSERDLDNASCVEIELDERRRRFVLPEETCNCAKYDLSSVDSLQETDTLTKCSQNETQNEENLEDENIEEEEEREEEKLEDIEFYQPDPNLPVRFLPTPEGEEEQEESVKAESEAKRSMCKIDTNYENQIDQNFQGSQTEVKAEEDKFHVYEIPEKFCVKRTSEVSVSTKNFSDATESTTVPIDNQTRSENLKFGNRSVDESFQNSDLLEKYKEKRILKDLAFQKLWDQRLKDMSNPRKGWIPTGDEIKVTTEAENIAEEEEQTSEENEASDDEEWADIVLESQQEQVKSDEDKLIVNFGVLRAIIDFVFKYFYESFQFSLIKLAFQATPELISQKVNEEWRIPKRIKQELQKPKVEKEKKKKEKPKKDKSSKASQKSKKDKSSKKSDKKGKKGSEKGSKKKEKKPKKEKPAKLTKEQKAELERQRKEQARLEEELRKLEENKRFMFPLTDAATDELFKGIFENWVKVDLAKKGKGKGKGGNEKKGKKGKK